MRETHDEARASELLRQIDDIGRDARRGGYSRHVFTTSEHDLREWFIERAERIGLDVETDRNGNMWAWWGTPGPDAVVTGSHLDSVPGGGAFDGPLGVVSALEAVRVLQQRGHVPHRPVAVVVFVEEEGGRFGVPCLGSRLLTGSLGPDQARELTDSEGVTLAEAAQRAGHDPARLGADPERLSRIGRFLELHVEQGRGLVDLSAPVAVGSTVLEHGRWRFTVSGQGNHAGATALADRHDPMVPAASAVSAARQIASTVDGARLTMGKFQPNPCGTNVIPSSVDVWLDARVPGEDNTRGLVAELSAHVRAVAAQEGCSVHCTEESYSDAVTFDAGLRAELTSTLDEAPELATGAGHDAAMLAPHLPAGMLYVRNPTGVSHSPEEHAEAADVDAGAQALARVLERSTG